MADEPNPTNQPTNQPPAPPTAPVPQSPASLITPEIQALIDAARSEERTKTQNATWAEARRKYEKQPDPPKQPQSEQSAAPQTGFTEEQFEQRLAVESALVRGIATHGLTAAQEAIVRQLYKVAKPPDVTSWIAETVTALGITPKPTTTATPSAPAAPAPASPPRAAAPAPVSAVPGDGPERVLGWTDAQVADFSAKNGGNGANPMHWSNRQAAIKIARLVEQEMAGMHFTARKR